MHFVLPLEFWITYFNYLLPFRAHLSSAKAYSVILSLPSSTQLDSQDLIEALIGYFVRPFATYIEDLNHSPYLI